MSKQFFALNDGSNPLACNLTELNAAESVDNGFMSHNDWIAHVNRYAYTGKVIQKSKPGTILDVGCGKLQLPYYLWRNRLHLEENGSYWGIELRAKQAWLEPINWKTSMNLIKADIILDEINEDNIEFWPGQFDLVTCFETWEHVPRDKAIILAERLFNWTKPGGILLFSSPNAGVSDSTADNHTDAEGESREWEMESKIEVLEDAGFSLHENFGTFCGITRLPEEFQERLRTDALLIQAKKFLNHANFTALVAAAYPQFSNNSLMHFVRRA